MRDIIEQHIVGIVKRLRSDAFSRAGPCAAVLPLRKYLENLSRKGLLAINAIMYAGRDQNPPRKIESYIDRCGIFTKEELMQAMLTRLDDLQEYLIRGLVLVRSNLDFEPGSVEI